MIVSCDPVLASEVCSICFFDEIIYIWRSIRSLATQTLPFFLLISQSVSNGDVKQWQ